jgi:hypothetical protein
MTYIKDFIEDIERIIMSDYSVTAKGYPIDSNEAEIRVYSDSKAMLSLIKDQYFIADEGAFIGDNMHDKHIPNSKYYLCAMKTFRV